MEKKVKIVEDEEVKEGDDPALVMRVEAEEKQELEQVELQLEIESEPVD